MFAAKSVQQVAVLPVRSGPDGPQVLMITSRRRGRWILPKGWPLRRRAPSEAAAREAAEEAGLAGRTADRSVGAYHYDKRMRGGYTVTCTVSVYPMRVTESHEDWPEREARKRAWMDFTTAADRADDPGLARLLADLAALSSDQLMARLEAPPPPPVRRPRGLLAALARLIGFDGAGAPETTTPPRR